MVRKSFRRVISLLVITTVTFLLFAPVAAQASSYEELELLKLINSYRAGRGLNKLVLSGKLTRSAYGHSRDMAVRNFFSHTSSNGADFVKRIRATGYNTATKMGENIAAGSWSAQGTFNSWKKSPGHNQVMLTKGYRAVGISRVYSPDSKYRWYWTADFGGIVDSSRVKASEDDNWAYGYVQKLEGRGVMSGYQDGSFRPDNPITRAEFVVMTVKSLGIGPKKGNAFSDTGRHWARDYISSLASRGYVSGYSKGDFRPNALITRAEMVKIITKAYGLKSSSIPSRFNDVSSGHWAKQYIATASSNGIVNGYKNGKFRPNAICLRSDAAASTCRLLD